MTTVGRRIGIDKDALSKAMLHSTTVASKWYDMGENDAHTSMYIFVLYNFFFISNILFIKL